MNEHAFRANHHTVLRRQMSNGVGFDAVHTIDASLGAQRSRSNSRLVSQRQRAGDGGTAGLVCGRAEYVVKNEGADSAVHVTGRTFVSCAERDVGPDAAGFVVNDQRRS